MGRSLTNNLSLAYAIEAALGSLSQATAATGHIDFTAQPSATETVTIDGDAYTFVSGVSAADDVNIGADLAETLSNLVAAINAGTGDGSAYGSGTAAHPSVYAYKGVAGRVNFVARTAGATGNSLTLATTVTGATASDSNLTGGQDAGDGAVSEWKLLEPNSIGGFGAEITTTARAPISKDRQRRKGTVTDLDSSADFEADATIDAFEDFIEGFVFAQAVHADLTFRGAHVANGAFQLQASDADLSASQANRLVNATDLATLLKARGYDNAANNGLHELSTARAAGDGELPSTGLADEDASANAVVELAGLRTDDVTWDWNDANQATATSAGAITDWSLWLTPGQIVHIGSPDGSGGVQNAFGASDTIFGYARVRSINGSAITFDKLSDALKSDGGAAKTTDFMFGRFIRNVGVDDTDYVERSFQFEAAYANLADPGPGDAYEYSKGNYCNELSFEMPLSDKATMSLGFIGTDTEPPTTTRKTGAASPRDPSGTSAFNTSADIARMRIQETDETGLTTDFKSLTMTLNNNASPEKVLGKLGAKFMNIGNFEVSIESQVLFTSPAVVSAIRNNTALGMDFVLKNDDQAVAVDVPRLTLGDGSKDFPVNESILINVTANAYGDPAAPVTTSLGFSFLPSVP